MRILGPICVLIAYVLLVSYYWHRLARENAAYDRWWYFMWIAKGLVFPIVIWFFLNLGHRPVMPPAVKVLLRRDVGQPPTVIFPPGAPPGTPPVIIPGRPKYIGVGPVGYVAIQTAAAMGVVGSFWGALTLGWFTVVFARNTVERRLFVKGSIVWGTLMVPVIALLIWYNGLGMLGFALSLFFLPILHFSVTLESEPEPLPHYTAAIVNIKFGKYAEAEQAIIKELEKCENHFEGWLMLAELYARQFGDVGEAERTVMDLCNDSATTLSQKSVALHKLADWHLQFREDPVSARRALEEIVKRMPGTHLARMAQLRLQQLPLSQQEWHERQQRGKKVKMPALNDSFASKVQEDIAESDPKEAERSANQYVEKLKRDPNDIAARENLARIFAERMGQAGLGISQLELLLEIPAQPANKMAEWLSLIAAWQIRYLEDKAAAQKTLRRIIREHPQTVQAFAAQRHLTLIEMEMN